MKSTNQLGRLVFALTGGSMLTIFGCSSATDTPSRSGASAPQQPARFDPSSARTAKASKSLQLAADWTPPSPTRSKPTHMKARAKATHSYGVATRSVGANPSDADFAAVSVLPEPLRPVPGESSKEETDAIARALSEEHVRTDSGAEALSQFVEAYPVSRWAPSVHLNLGTLSYHTGYFQDALSHWKAAWELAKGAQDPASEQIANEALAKYARMNARIGRTPELEAILDQAQGRTMSGNARVEIEGAAEGLWMMRHQPAVSFLCGPYALANVAQVLNPAAAKKATAFVQKLESPPSGFSVPEVHRMAAKLGVNLQIAKRDPGAAVIVPAVVHWKVGHFGALVRDLSGSYLLQDPTFRNDISLTAKALDQEASGYFLVPDGPLPAGWTQATAQETGHLFGRGYTDNIDEDETSDDDDKAGGDCVSPESPDPAMAVYRMHTLAASLHIRDTPVGYTAAAGPDVHVRVAYNQREASQPTTMTFTNFGPQFVSNWVSYLVDNPSSPGANVTLRKRGGGGEVHSSFNVGTQTYGIEGKRAARLQKLSANTYKKMYPDGSEEYYEQYIGTVGTQRKVFLSRVVDAQGNEVAIEYDSTYPERIHQIIDATGLATVFHYDYVGKPYLVTSIEDPFGRTGTFAYTSAAGQLRLQSIEDPYEIVSTFTYSTAGEIVAMTTPYGTTTFNLSSPFVNTGENLIRYIEATDPLGQTERIEYNISSVLTGVPSSLEMPRPSTSVVNFATSWNNYRNTFYWDKLRMKLAQGDYSKAHRYHWTHSTNNSVTSILESEVPPLEGRIFYNYPGQTNPLFRGTLASPSVVARVVKDAQGNDQTQATKYEYNSVGNRTKVIDPVGRETLTEYAANGVDVVAVKQKTGVAGGLPVWTTVASYTYGNGAPPHRPATATDGAGETTHFTYTPTGQVATITNPKGEVTTFTYETDPALPSYDKLLSVTGDVPGGNRTFTYDSAGRMRTATDSEGYTLTYDYDDLDRVRAITYPDSTVEQFEYEDQSLVASKDRAGRWTRHMYNGLRQRVLTQDPSFRTTQFQWCRCGELRRFIDGNGNGTEWERDVRDRVTKKKHADGSFDAYAYDFSGRLLSEVDPMGRTVTYQYTVDDRVSKKDYSDAATPDVTYAFDPHFPRLTSRQDGAGTTSFSYHPYGSRGAGQLARVNGPLVDDTLKHTYDELGRLKKLEIVDDATYTTASYSEEFSFDARGRVVGTTNNLGSTSYAFVGQSGRPSTVNYPNGMQVLYDYFGANGDFLLKQIKNLSAGSPRTTISQFDYTYGPDRSIRTWTVDQGSGATTSTFGYDESKQLTSAVRRDASQTVLESLTYGYDKAGNRVQVGTGSTAPKNYEANNLNQLLAERDHGPTTFAGFVDEAASVKINGKPAKVMSTDGGAPFKFEALVSLDAGANSVVVEAKDGRNNSATKTYSVTTAGTSKTYEYDANGNLRFEKLPGGNVEREYRWDQQNRLVRMLTGAHESVYEYDGESRRIRIKELESNAETRNDTFVWCGSRICQKRSGSTVLRSYFVQGFQEGVSKYFYTNDHVGSVRELVGTDGTTIASRARYSPWGELVESGSVQTDFAYAGHYLDRPSSLGLTQYRGYSPQLGRWLTRDPIGLAGGLNLYAYVENSPINFVDLDGHGPVEFAACLLSGKPLALCIVEEKNRFDHGPLGEPEPFVCQPRKEKKCKWCGCRPAGSQDFTSFGSNVSYSKCVEHCRGYEEMACTQ